MKSILISWKTTTVGFAGAFGEILLPYLQSGHISKEQIWIAAAMAGIGLFSRDHDVHGNPPTEDDKKQNG